MTHRIRPRTATFALLTALVVLSGPALAVRPDEMLSDPKLEARARSISAELRCLVCQNQSIDDSDADLARDLRILVREHLTAGETDSEIKDYLVARYGEYVLLRPRFEWDTALLWGAGPLTLLLGGVAIFMARRRTRAAPDRALSDAEEARLKALLAASRGED